METNILEYIEWNRCETCNEERVFGNPPNTDSDNLYIYIDLSWSTRCFCKQHMSYSEWVIPNYWAELISDVINRIHK